LGVLSKIIDGGIEGVDQLLVFNEGWEASFIFTFLLELNMQDVGVCFNYSNNACKTIDREPMDLEESDCLIKTKQRESLITGLTSL